MALWYMDTGKSSFSLAMQPATLLSTALCMPRASFYNCITIELRLSSFIESPKIRSEYLKNPHPYLLIF